MQVRRDTARVRFAFDSLPEMGRFIENTERDWKQNYSAKMSAGQQWDLGASFKDAVRLSQDGWLEGAKRLRKALDRIPPATVRPDVRNDFYGHTPNVPRFCAGAPDSMIRHVKDANSGAGRVLSIYVPVNAMAGVSAEHMANFGLAVVQCLDHLEASGTRIELYGAICSRVSGVRVTHTFKIKRADQHLDLAVVAFAIGHPAMFRRLGFAARERSQVREDFSYGMSLGLQLADIVDPAPGSFVLNGMKDADTHARSPEAALKYVTRQIQTAIANTELPD